MWTVFASILYYNSDLVITLQNIIKVGFIKIHIDLRMDINSQGEERQITRRYYDIPLYVGKSCIEKNEFLVLALCNFFLNKLVCTFHYCTQ